jgi:hypothetical protein
LRLLGQAKLGVYKDECEGVHPDVINKYYGVHGKTVHHNATGAGHPIDEDDNSQPPLAEQIASDQQSHVHHAGVAVPLHGNPFGNSTADEDKFWRILSNVVEEKITPEGVGLHCEEWDDGVYPSYEILQVGNRGTKEIHISLADVIWEQRAKLWGQAQTTLSVMQMYS